jgi:UDP-arabinose 4-epimerase
MRPRVLVIGGAGYIGAHTCRALASTGFDPIAFDNLSTGHRDFVRWGPLVEGDIRNTAAVTEAVRSFEAVAAIHFAACAYVGESVVEPQKYYENNVLGTLSLLRGLFGAGCKKLVFSSTCAVYGQPERVPIDEAARPEPVNPYGRSKLMVEQILADFATAYSLNSVILRYFNACGASPEGHIGELRDPETHLIPRAMMALQGHIDDFRVFGSDYPTPDGTAIRDYVHVDDLAEAHVAALRLLLAGRRGDTFNLGTGQGYSVKQVLNAIETETGERLPAANGPRRPGDPAVLVADAARARALLGFSPRVSGLATIVRTAWAWHRQMHPKKMATV